MENEIIVASEGTPVVQFEAQMADDTQIQPYPVYYEERESKLVDEVIAAVKDDRMNTKRAISAGIQAMAWVQNQNDRVITACEHELRRKDLPEERRAELIETMRRAAESTVNESAACRGFQERHLGQSHKLPWKILGWSALVLVLGICGAARLRAAA